MGRYSDCYQHFLGGSLQLLVLYTTTTILLSDIMEPSASIYHPKGNRVYLVPVGGTWYNKLQGNGNSYNNNHSQL